MTALRFDIETMRTVMSAPFEWFEIFGVVREGKTSGLRKTARHIYIDRGADVLGVAHLDSVRPFSHFWINHEYIACPTVDNRIGAWLMLYGLPSLGIEFDVLLTENEECGWSTAEDFEAPKQYNWGFSFDRAGDDVVAYQYENKELTDLLAQYGLDMGWGSYSDISTLDIEAKCINVGCGMHNYHSDQAHVRISELAQQIRRFAAFYADHHGTHMPYSYKEYSHRWDDYDWDNWKAESYAYTGTGKWWQDTNKLLLPARQQPRWGMIESYQAQEATSDPNGWFEDQDYDASGNPDDWHYGHSMGDINRMGPDDDATNLYFDGILICCDSCENLFVQGDIDRYTSLNMRLCKSCFFWMAAEEGFPER